MKSYSATAKHWITGRGMVLMVNIPEKEEYPDRDEIVLVDEHLYMVRHCEFVFVGPGFRRKINVGLMVKSTKDDYANHKISEEAQ